VDRTRVNVDRIEQRGCAVRIRVEPALEGDLFEVFRLSRARLDLRLVHVLDVRLLPVVRFSADGGNVEAMRGFEIRSVVEAADERVNSNIDSALDVAVAPQRKIREPAIAGAMRNCIAVLAVVIGRSNACSNLISCACVRPKAR
jgi:hypothetical protein